MPDRLFSRARGPARARACVVVTVLSLACASAWALPRTTLSDLAFQAPATKTAPARVAVSAATLPQPMDCATLAALPVQPLRFAHLRQHAWCVHPQLLQARAALESAQAGVARADAAWRPTLGVAGSVSDDRTKLPSASSQEATTSTLRWTAAWTAWDRTRPVAAQRAELQRTLAERQLQQTEDTVLRTLHGKWLALELAAMKVAGSQAQLAAAQQLLRAASARQEKGLVTRVEVLQAQAETAQAQFRLGTDQQTLEQAWRELGLAVGAGIAWPTALTGEELGRVLASGADVHAFLGLQVEKQLDGLDPVARREHFERLVTDSIALKVAQLQEALTQNGVETAKATLGPTLATQLYHQDQRRAGGTTGIQGVTLTLNVPLYTGGVRDADVARAVADRFGQVALTQQTTDKVRAQALKLSGDLPLAHQQLQAAEAARDAARAALEMAQGRYVAGVGALTEALQAQKAMVDADLAALTALRQLQELHLDWLDLAGLLRQVAITETEVSQ